MKRFSDWTDQELLTMTNEQMVDAIKIEAIECGIEPPIALPEALRQSEWRGYQTPAEHIKVWQLVADYHKSGIGYLSEELALRALEGLVRISEHGYRTGNFKVEHKEVSAELVLVGVSPATSKEAQFQEAITDESAEYKELKNDCVNRFRDVHQAAYDSQVNAAKKAEYMRLAGGNESIAKAFWEKSENIDWPSDIKEPSPA